MRVSEEQIRHFLTSVSQGILYQGQLSMWSACLGLYPGGERAACTEGLM